MYCTWHMQRQWKNISIIVASLYFCIIFLSAHLKGHTVTNQEKKKKELLFSSNDCGNIPANKQEFMKMNLKNLKRETLMFTLYLTFTNYTECFAIYNFSFVCKMFWEIFFELFFFFFNEAVLKCSGIIHLFWAFKKDSNQINEPWE